MTFYGRYAINSTYCNIRQMLMYFIVDHVKFDTVKEEGKPMIFDTLTEVYSYIQENLVQPHLDPWRVIVPPLELMLNEPQKEAFNDGLQIINALKKKGLDF